MSINGIGATNSSMMYAYASQIRQNNSAESTTTNSVGSRQGPPPPPPVSSNSEDSSQLADELGVRVRMSGEDSGFNSDQLAEMASSDSPMSELFSALADNFDEADTNGDGVIKRDEAMAYAKDNGIDVPPPPGQAQSSSESDSGFSLDQLSEMASSDSPMSTLFSALADNFDEADSNGDGVIKRDEAMSYAKENGIDMPTPPAGSHGAAKADNGFTADQLTEMASQDSGMSELFTALSENFSTADANGDGVVSRDEAMIYAKNNEIDIPEPGSHVSVTA